MGTPLRAQDSMERLEMDLNRLKGLMEREDVDEKTLRTATKLFCLMHLSSLKQEDTDGHMHPAVAEAKLTIDTMNDADHYKKMIQNVEPDFYRWN